MQDVVVVSRRGGVVTSTKCYGGGAENGDATQGTPGQRGKAAVHEEGQEEALPVGLSTQRGGQRLLDRPLLWRYGEKRGGNRCYDAVSGLLRGSQSTTKTWVQAFSSLYCSF